MAEKSFSSSSQKLTPKEHEARAMLMGLWYDKTTHTYCDETFEFMDIDADTLEIVSMDELIKRKLAAKAVIHGKQANDKRRT